MKSSKPVSSFKAVKGPKSPGPSPIKPLILDCAHTPGDPKSAQEVVYTISFRNPNKNGVSSIQIEYNTSSGMNSSYINFISATDGGMLHGTDKITWDSLGSLGPGESGIVSFTIRMHDAVDPFGSILYSASVSIQSAQTPTTTIEHLTEVMPWADLVWAVSCPKTVKRGQAFQYIISIFNNATSMITALRGHASFSPDVTFIGFYDSAGDPVVIDLLGSLMGGQSMTVTAKVKVNANAPQGTDVICMNCSFLSDESAGNGSGICCSCK